MNLLGGFLPVTPWRWQEPKRDQNTVFTVFAVFFFSRHCMLPNLTHLASDGILNRMFVLWSKTSLNQWNCDSLSQIKLPDKTAVTLLSRGVYIWASLRKGWLFLHSPVREYFAFPFVHLQVIYKSEQSFVNTVYYCKTHTHTRKWVTKSLKESTEIFPPSFRPAFVCPPRLFLLTPPSHDSSVARTLTHWRWHT